MSATDGLSAPQPQRLVTARQGQTIVLRREQAQSRRAAQFLAAREKWSKPHFSPLRRFRRKTDRPIYLEHRADRKVIVVKQSIINAVQRVIAFERKLSQHNPEAAAAGSVTLPTGGHRVAWLKPTPLPNAEPPAIRYPVECLSPGLRKVVEAMAKKTQAPEAIAAQSVLAVVSLAFASRAKVQTLGSFSNAACFFVLIALSGERKSATDGWAMGGVNRTVLELRAEHAQLLRDYEQAVETIERGGERPPRPVCPNFLVTEPTVEGAFKAISSGAGFLGWFTDEAATFWGGHSMSQEKQALTCGILSKFWDGSFFIRPRVTQEGDGYVPPTPTTVNLMFQPNLIRGTYGNDFMLGQGILARMLPAWPQSNMGNRKFRRSEASDDAIVAAFQDLTASALRDTLEDPTEKLLELSDGAFRECVAFHDAIEPELGRGKWAADISSFAAKAPEHACRLAALMTLFEDQAATVVSESTMVSACEIVRYHLQQFKHLCAAGINEDAVAHAQKLLDWLKSNLKPGSGFPTEMILQNGPVRTRNRQRMDQALDILIQHAWIKPLPAGSMVDGKLRKKAFMLNPNA